MMSNLNGIPSCGNIYYRIHFDPLVMHTIALLRYSRKINCYRAKTRQPPPLPVFSPIKLKLPDL